MWESLLQLDRDVFAYLNRLGSEQWDGLWLFITNKYSFVPLYGLLLYLIVRKMGWKAALLSLVAVAVLIASTDQLANLFKYGVQRLRPCQSGVFEEGIRIVAARCGKYGYFSAHAASSMALAVFIGRLLRGFYPKLLLLLVLWSLVVSYSRIYVGVHYPLDILTGMLMGAGVGIFYHWVFRRVCERLL